jgi:uncharacterized protein YqeY
MKAAMKAKDKVSLRGIRAIKAALMLAKTDGTGEEMTPEKEIKIVQKMVKQRKDSLSIYKEQGRDDLASVEIEEIDVISKYLPEQLSEEKIGEIVEGIISDLGAEGMKDMGKVMGVASQKLAGSADGKTLAAVVRQKLA